MGRFSDLWIIIDLRVNLITNQCVYVIVHTIFTRVHISMDDWKRANTVTLTGTHTCTHTLVHTHVHIGESESNLLCSYYWLMQSRTVLEDKFHKL